MKYKLHYGTGVLNLPAAVMDRLRETNGDFLKILICIAAGKNPSKEKLMAETGCSALTVDIALEHFEKAGILTEAESGRKKATISKEAPASEPTPVTTVDSAAPVTPAPVSLPRYSTEELVTLLEKRRELASLVDECSRIFGKVFST